ncbi:MAG TPA: cupin domain-containing protein [Bacteroidales bacterium]|nr:cupin domain-containing protein [Bacteroidales bacterium]
MTKKITKINLSNKFDLFEDHWSPKIAGELNGQQVRLVKMKGPFVWHSHSEEDELFLVIEGQLIMEFREQREVLGPGEMIIIPHGTEHRPVAIQETKALLFEPSSTLNTGNTNSPRRVDDPERI